MASYDDIVRGNGKLVSLLLELIIPLDLLVLFYAILVFGGQLNYFLIIL